MMKTQKPLNLVLVGLDRNFCRAVSEELSYALDMHFADFQELVEYELSDKQLLLEKCGLSFLKEKETQAICRAASYENTIFSCNFDIFKNNSFPFSMTLYLALPEKSIDKKNVIDKLAFDRHHRYLKENCNATIEIINKNVKQAAKKIISTLKELV